MLILVVLLFSFVSLYMRWNVLGMANIYHNTAVRDEILFRQHAHKIIGEVYQRVFFADGDQKDKTIEPVFLLGSGCFR